MPDGSLPQPERAVRASLRERVDALTAPGEPEPPGPGAADRLRDGLGVLATFCVSTVALLLSFVMAPTLLFGWTPTAIESGSMRPAIERGDVVLLRSVSVAPLPVGTVIRFRADDDGSVVHRIASVDTDLGAYITRGDANPTDDSAPVPFENVAGVGTMLVPLVGHPVLWFHEGRHLLLLLAGLAAVAILGPGLAAGQDVRPMPEPQRSPEPLTARSVAAVLDLADADRPLVPFDPAGPGPIEAPDRLRTPTANR